MSEIGVGKEVLSYCSKCKLTLSHTIATMKSAKSIGKVECRTCKATHAYKDPSKVKSRGIKSQTDKSKNNDSVADIWMNAINKSSAKSQDYSLKKQFHLGDIIDHPKFGPGVVEKLVDQNKIQVIFRHDIKTLMHNLD